MQLKTYFIVSLSLPAAGTYIGLHHHEAEKAAEWTEEDTAKYQALVAQVRAGKTITNNLTNEKYADPEADGQSGSLRVLPYLLEVASSRRPVSPFIDEKTTTVLSKKLIGTEHVRPVILNKVPGTVVWAEDLEGLAGNDIAHRSSPNLLQAVAAHSNPAQKGLLQLAVVPGGVKVSLARNSQGEFVREVPKTWA